MLFLLLILNCTGFFPHRQSFNLHLACLGKKRKETRSNVEYIYVNFLISEMSVRSIAPHHKSQCNTFTKPIANSGLMFSSHKKIVPHDFLMTGVLAFLFKLRKLFPSHAPNKTVFGSCNLGLVEHTLAHVRHHRGSPTLNLGLFDPSEWNMWITRDVVHEISKRTAQ